MTRRRLQAAVLAAVLPVLTVQSAEPTRFTAAAEKRAKLLAQVRQQDAARAARKKAGPVVTIVKAGHPQAVIVCTAGKMPKGRRGRATGDMAAALLLQSWVELMSGAKLPIAAQKTAGKPAVYVGAAAVAAGCRVDDIKSKTDEGLRVRCDGTDVFIAAQSEAALVRAVGRFLENEFGCRWFTDLPWGREYPEAETLTVLKDEFSEKPTALYRRIWGPEGAFRNATWRSWNGHGGRAIPMGHSWNFLNKDDFEQHPEWFRMDANGKRVKGHWPNLGNPEVRKMFMAWAMKASAGGKRGISLSPPDDHRVDYSPEAKKWDEPKEIDPTAERVSMTNRFLYIANEAAKKIYEVNPDALCGFYAYSDYTMPPTKPALKKLSPNLCIWIAPIRYSRYHPLGHPNSPSRQLLKEMVLGWGECADKLGWRTYNYNLAEVNVPFSKITVWSHDIPLLHKLGCIGTNLESQNAWEIYAPHLYLSIRLAYDPTLDPWLIMADYWDKCYGPAAGPMEKYWMQIDESFANIKSEAGSFHALHLVYTPERIKQLGAHLDKAEKLAAGGSKNQQYRVMVARRGYRRAVYWRRFFDATNRGDVDGAKKIYDEWAAFVQDSLKRKHSNKYSYTYLRRFISKNLDNAYRAVHPKDAPANKVLAVLPDEWKTATGDEIRKAGAKGNPYEVNYDDSSWKTIKTYSDTRNAQGLPEYFGDMWYRVSYKAPRSSKDLLLHFQKADRKVTVYINGKQVNEKEQEGFRGTTVDINGHLKPGEDNQITVLVRHIPMPELFLGGIVGPIYLIEKGK